MLDLACHVWRPSLTRLTRPAVRAFAGLCRAAPRLRRHGYLLATVAVKPAATESTPGPAGGARVPAGDAG
jgi:hypothetical protein